MEIHFKIGIFTRSVSEDLLYSNKNSSRTAIPFIEYYLISFPTKQRKKYLDDQRKCDKSLTKIKPRIIYEFMHSRNKVISIRGNWYLLNIEFAA